MNNERKIFARVGLNERGGIMLSGHGMGWVPDPDNEGFFIARPLVSFEQEKGLGGKIITQQDNEGVGG